MTVKILVGDVRQRLAELADESVHCAVLSPPYWGLRDYGTAKWVGGDPECKHRVIGGTRTAWANSVKGPTSRGKNGTDYANMTKVVGGVCEKCSAVKVDAQLGLEPTLAEHLAAMVEVMREVRRVLRKDGTVWLNYGDCYATAPNGRSAADTKATGNDDRTFRDKPFSTVGGTLKAKDLCMVPNRLAIALQEDGWWVRSEIIWHKPNPMPESIRDRPGTAHEKIFLLSKSERYFYDDVAVRLPAAESSIGRWAQDVDGQTGSLRANGGAKTNGAMKAVGGPRKQNQTAEASASAGGSSGRRMAGFNDRWDAKERARRATDHDEAARPPDSRPQNLSAFEAANERQYASRNLRNVWTIGTEPFSEAHFATFPTALVEPCIKAGTSEHGCCVTCAAPWERIMAKFEEVTLGWLPTCRCTPHKPLPRHPAKPKPIDDKSLDDATRLAWQAECRAVDNRRIAILEPLQAIPTARPIVLDPFGGSGTVGLVADRLGRDAILIELNPEYAAMAERRIKGDAPLFTQVAAQ